MEETKPNIERAEFAVFQLNFGYSIPHIFIVKGSQIYKPNHFTKEINSSLCIWRDQSLIDSFVLLWKLFFKECTFTGRISSSLGPGFWGQNASGSVELVRIIPHLESWQKF